MLRAGRHGCDLTTVQPLAVTPYSIHARLPASDERFPGWYTLHEIKTAITHAVYESDIVIGLCGCDGFGSDPTVYGDVGSGLKPLDRPSWS